MNMNSLPRIARKRKKKKKFRQGKNVYDHIKEVYVVGCFNTCRREGGAAAAAAAVAMVVIVVMVATDCHGGEGYGVKVLQRWLWE